MTSGGGVVIEPVFNTAQILALTMGTFVQRLLGHLNGQRDLPPAPPQVQTMHRALPPPPLVRVNRAISGISVEVAAHLRHDVWHRHAVHNKIVVTVAVSAEEIFDCSQRRRLRELTRASPPPPRRCLAACTYTILAV